jgi:hypothetical protein
MLNIVPILRVATKNPLHLLDDCADCARIMQRVLPNAKNSYTLRRKNSFCFPISASVPLDFCLPKFSASSRDVTTSWATVPEAAINKDRNFLPLEIKVWFSTNSCLVKHPALDPNPYKCHFERKLCGFVALATNSRHGSGSLRRDFGKPAVFKFGFQKSFHLIACDKENSIAH